ncbi:MAG: hypothetical protein AAB884_00500 [Patescibacteria group bacterium]
MTKTPKGAFSFYKRAKEVAAQPLHKATAGKQIRKFFVEKFSEMGYD